MQNKLALITVRSGDPFEYQPQLRTIWPSPYAEKADEASREYANTGEIMYVVYGGRVVGITGIFFDEAAPHDVFLRWTGIIEGFRRVGLGSAVIAGVAELCRKQYPNAIYLVELVPDNEYGHTVAKPFFEALGFEPDIGVIPPSEDSEWPCIRYALNLKLEDSDMINRKDGTV